MKKVPILVISGFAILVYFGLTVLILPEQYMSNKQSISEPFFKVEISNQTISLGESFRVEISTKNIGEYGDIHILSTAFPDLKEINEIVQITTYDFSQSPTYIVPGDELIAKYSGGLERTIAKYPSIEAMSRPILPDAEFHMSQVITPKAYGNFTIYVKSINIPHNDETSHYPQTGNLDHQEEYVQAHTIIVNP